MFLKLRFREGFVIFSLFLTVAFCSPNKRRAVPIPVGTNSTEIDSSDLVTQVKSESDSSIDSVKVHGPSKRLKKSEGFSFESLVSAFAASPETWIQMDKLKSSVMNYFEKKSISGDARGGHGGGHGGHGGQHGLGYGGIGFPSLEGALLTLAFLTFAVFLIDLIQRLVSGYSSGQASPFFGRRKRDLPEPKLNNQRLSTLTANVMTSIESPLFD